MKRSFLTPLKAACVAPVSLLTLGWLVLTSASAAPLLTVAHPPADLGFHEASAAGTISDDNLNLSTSPDQVEIALPVETFATQEIVLLNPSSAEVNWTLRFARPPGTSDPAASRPVADTGPALATIPLETILENLNRRHDPIRAANPSRYPFSEGATGNYISDGGGDMYDQGNILSTSLAPTAPLAYSDNTVVAASASLGTGGRYFTRKFDGLWVFAADIAGLGHFEINGNLGADGGGSTDTAVLTQNRRGVTYKGFVKRVYGTSDPSVNHLVIVADNGSLTHEASPHTDDNHHRVSGLSGVTRLYYLLYAGQSGAYVDDSATTAIFTAFLDAIGTPDFVTANPASGTLPAGASAIITLDVSAAGLSPGIYQREIHFSSDAAQPLLVVPLRLAVQDRVLDHFVFDPLPTSLVRGAPATVRLRAVDAEGLPVVLYDTPLNLVAQGTTLAAPVTAPTWVSGVWTGQITPVTYADSATLSVHAETGIGGTSPAFAVAKGPLAQLSWNSVSSTQSVDTPFPVSVFAADAGGNPLDTFSGDVTLFALLPTPLDQIGTNYHTHEFPFAGGFPTARQQILLPAYTLDGARRLTGVSLNVPTPSTSSVFNEWTIRLKHSSRTSLSDGLFDNEAWTTVHVSNATISASGWWTFDFSTPFEYDGSSALLVDFSFRNPGTTTPVYSFYSNYLGSAAQAINNASYETGTDPAAFTFGYVSHPPVVRFITQLEVPVRPANAMLNGGTWSGSVSLPSGSGLVQLRASSSEPLTSGDSNRFDLSPARPTPTIFPFFEDFESGTFGAPWTITGTNFHRTQIRTDYTPGTGAYHLILDSSAVGTYSRNEATLTLDLAGRTGVVLSFQAKRLGGSPSAPATNPFTGSADFDGVTVSPDGITWFEVEPLRDPALTGDWQAFSVDLDPVLAARGWFYTNAFRIRFNRYGNDYTPYDGIAIDDISVAVSHQAAVTVTLPAFALESAAPLVGTLDVPAASGVGRMFTLDSSAPAKLTVPATVLLPAGQTSVAFAATLIDDSLLDGSKPVIITAEPPAGSGLLRGFTTIRVDDDESPALSLAVSPDTIAENGPAALGILTLGTTPAAPLTVTLTSSDPTAATVPATVTFAAGQRTATFAVTPVNDDWIDGPQATRIGASFGSRSVDAVFTVTDDETTHYFLTSADPVEGQTVYGHISLSGRLVHPLVVNLSSSDPDQLTVPASMTIPAGSSGAAIPLTAVDDSETDGAVTVTITVSAPGFPTTTTTATARDNDLHHFSVAAYPESPQLANRAFSVVIHPCTIDGDRAAFADGTVSLSARSGSTTLPVTPDSLSFTDSSLDASVSVNTPASGVTLRVDDGAGHTGVSAPFDVTVGPLHRFAFSPIPSPQSATLPFPLTITALDQAGNVARSFAGTAALSAVSAPQPVGDGTDNLSHPFSGRQSRTQIIYLGYELGGAGRIAGLALDFASFPGGPLQNVTIRIKPTSLSAYPGGVSYYWEASDWTTVYQGSPVISTTGWFPFTFTTPFEYDGTTNLLVDISHNSSNHLSNFAKGYSTAGVRSLRLTTSGQSHPSTWSGFSPTPIGSTGVPNLRLTYAHDTVSITPATTGAFVNGAWTGNVAASAPGTDIIVQAVSGNASGTSEFFSAQPGGLPLIAVTAGDFSATGYRAGPLSPTSATWTIFNPSGSSVTWSANHSASWFSLSPASGTLTSGASVVVTATLNAEAETLAVGAHSDSIVFFNQTNGLGSTVRRVDVSILPVGDLVVTPGDLVADGPRGGPFTPASTAWTLSNPGDASLTWTAAASASWFSLDVTGGTLAPGATVLVTATIHSDADALAAGEYTGAVAFSNTHTGRGNTARAVVLTVRAVAPRIVTQPAGTTVSPGENAALRVVATGDGTYQWYRGSPGVTTAPVPGATGPLLVTPPLTVSANFWVRVTNSVGSVDSTVTTVTVVLLPDLSLEAVGDNSFGTFGNGTTISRSSPVHVATPVAQISAGTASGFLKPDGTLWTMGYNGFGGIGDGTTVDRHSPVLIASGVAQLSMGSYSGMFIKTDGTLWAMGRNAWGQLGDGTTTQRPSPVQIASNVVTVASGGSHSFFVKTDGTLWGMGYNGNGQLGDGSTTDRHSPVQVASGVVQVTIGGNNTHFIKADGSLWAMGFNGSGPLGDGTTSHRSSPIQVASDVVQVSSGGAFSMWVKADGSLWATGANTYGQFGDGTTTSRLSPVQVATGIARVSAGNSHSISLRTNRTLWGAGHNGQGQLGDGSAINRTTPVLIAPAVFALSAGDVHNLFLSRRPGLTTQPVATPVILGQTATLTVAATGIPPFTYQWYQGESGDTRQPIADATTPSFTTPLLDRTTRYWVRVSNDHGHVDSSTATVTVTIPPTIITPPVATTTHHRGNPVLSVTADGVLLTFQWYRGPSGTTTDPIPGATGPFLVAPPLVATTSFWVRVTNIAGTTDSAAVTVTRAPIPDLDLFGFGGNAYGALGDGSTTRRTHPELMLSGIASIAAGTHSLILKSDGSLWGTGANRSGQLGDGTRIDRLLPVPIAIGVVDVAAGDEHSLFIRADGSLWAMGRNTYGQLGDGTTTDRLTPVQIATQVVQAAAGAHHSLFLKSDGTLWAMGYNGWGTLGDGTTTNRLSPVQILVGGVSRIGAAGYSSLFIKPTGTLWRMGANLSGQLGDGTSNSRATPVQVASEVIDAASGPHHLLLVKSNHTLWACGSRYLGQIGNLTGLVYSPVQIATGVTRAFAGDSHSLFLKTDRTLWGTGLNNEGQVGDGTTTNRFSPRAVASSVVSAAGGSLHSLVLRDPAPRIVAHPASDLVLAGDTAALEVGATSPDALSYQWYHGASGDLTQPVSGATTAVLVTSALSADASYWVRVSNAAGSTDSLAATLTIRPASPVLDAEPTVTGGTTNTLSWDAISGADAYQVQASSHPDFSAPLESDWIAALRHTFGPLTEHTWRFRTRYRQLRFEQNSWRQSTASEFFTGTLLDVDATTQRDQIRLVTRPLLTETFDAAATWSETAFADVSAGTFEIRPLLPLEATATTPPLPINPGGDNVAVLSGTLAYALTTAPGFTNGAIETYFTSNGSNPGLYLRASRSGGQISGYLARAWYHGVGSFQVDVFRMDNGVSTRVGGFHSIYRPTSDQNVRMRFSVEGSVFRLRLWLVSVTEGFVVETLIPYGSTEEFVFTDSVIAGPGKAGLFVNGAASAYFDDVKVFTSAPLYSASGEITSSLIAPTDRTRWQKLTYSATTPTSTTVRIDVLDAVGELLAADLPSGTDLGAIPAVTSAPAIRLRARLATTDPASTPILHDWQVDWQAGETTPLLSHWSPVVTSIQDATAPVLTLTSPTTVTRSAYTLAGTATDANGIARLTVNGPLATTTNGFANWSRPLSLQPGENHLTLLASDSASPPNTRTETVTVTLVDRLPDTDLDDLPDAWENAHGLDPAASTGHHGAHGDPDGDGLPNLLEYACGLDPRSPDASPLLLTFESHPVTGEKHLVVSYPRLLDPGALVYTLETSSGLSDWATPTVAPEIVSIAPHGDGRTETVTFRVEPALGPTPVFVRLVVHSP